MVKGMSSVGVLIEKPMCSGAANMSKNARSHSPKSEGFRPGSPANKCDCVRTTKSVYCLLVHGRS